jgi:hypothetical protein
MRLRDAEKLHEDDEVTLKKGTARACAVTNLSAIVLTTKHDSEKILCLDVLLNGGKGPFATLRHDEVL